MIAQDLVTGARFMGAASMIVMAVIVAVLNRGKVQSRMYNRSRWMFFAACMLLGIHNLVQFFGHFREESACLAWIINLVFDVPLILAFNLGERNILYAGQNMKKPIVWTVVFNVLCYLLVGIGLATGTIINDEKPYMTVTCLVALCLFLEILHMACRMRRDMKLLDKRLTDEDLEDCHRFLRYTARSQAWLLYLAFLTPWIGMSGNLVLNGLYGLLMFGIILWLVIGFCIYGHDMPEVISVSDEIYEAIAVEKDKAASLREPAASAGSSTEQLVEKWVSERKFTNPDLTIGTALQEMQVSATAFKFYLEQNTEFQHFSQWLTYLRVEEAKRLMREHPNYALDTIAEACGYSSRSTLFRAFKAQEGVNPTKWMTRQKEQA